MASQATKPNKLGWAAPVSGVIDPAAPISEAAQRAKHLHIPTGEDDNDKHEHALSAVRSSGCPDRRAERATILNVTRKNHASVSRVWVSQVALPRAAASIRSRRTIGRIRSLGIGHVSFSGGRKQSFVFVPCHQAGSSC